MHKEKKEGANYLKKAWEVGNPSLTLIATIIIAAFSVVSGIFTAELSRTAALQRDDLVEQGKQLDAATKAASDTAAATQDIAKISERMAASIKETAAANKDTAVATNNTAAWLAEVAKSAKAATELSQQANATAEQAANATSSSAKTQVEALNDSRINFARQMRAFVSVKGTRLAQNRNTNQLVATINFHNSGVTPAKNVMFHWNFVCVTPQQESQIFALRVPTTPPVPPQASPTPPLAGGQLFLPRPELSIGPDVALQEQQVISMTAADWAAWDGNSVRCTVYGHITYFDEFGNFHFTNFRFREGVDLETNAPMLVLADDNNGSN